MFKISARAIILLENLKREARPGVFCCLCIETVVFLGWFLCCELDRERKIAKSVGNFIFERKVIQNANAGSSVNVVCSK